MPADVEPFVERVLAQVKRASVDLALLPPGGPSASIYGGGAGVAFFLYEAARLRGEAELLLLAHRWCAAATKQAERSQASAWHDIRFGFVHGEGGLSYVEALLALRDGDSTRVLAAVERLRRAASRVAQTPRVRPTELFGGAAGLLRAARTLLGRLPSASGYDASKTILARVRDRAIALLLERHGAAVEPALGDLVGFSHGIAGELWSLVAALGADHDVVRDRLAALAALRALDESGLTFWLPNGQDESAPMLSTLCHGMPGHTLLWCEVAKQSPADAAMELARRSAESTSVLVSPLPTLCCGLTGQAVALYKYAELSGNEQFTRRADVRLQRAVRNVERDDDVPLLGLWRGKLGIALVAMARLHGERTIPCFE